MPKVKADVKFPRIDIPRTKDKIGSVMVNFVVDVLGEWVSTTTDVIPVWSGASRATFLQLATAAGVGIEIESFIVAPIGSRIPLGIETTTSEALIDPRSRTGQFGWSYESILEYLNIVEGRTNFLEHGRGVVERRGGPQLPQPIFIDEG